MALIPCPACSHSVSVEARSCPRCGHPLRSGLNRFPVKRIAVATLAVFLAVLQIVVQSAQGELGIFLIALGTVAVGVATVKGVARLRGTETSPRTLGLTIILAPTIAFIPMGAYYIGAGLGSGVVFWIIYALSRSALKGRPAPAQEDSESFVG
jgi:hypothetical protein